MRRASLVLSVLLMFLSDAEACGRRGRVTRRHCQPVYGSPQVVYAPRPTYSPWPLAAPQAYQPRLTYGPRPFAAPEAYEPRPTYGPQPLAAPLASSYPPPASSPPAIARTLVPPPPQAATGAQPLHDYTAATSGERRAYYYTYDSSGKLIIQQWMDFLFRGGKEAGMPRPPLPLIGRLQRN